MTNQLRSLEYKLEFNQITQEEYDNKIEEIEAKKMKLEKEKEEKTSTKKKSKKTRTKTNKGDTNKETEQSGTTSLGELMRECDIVSESSTDSDN